MPESELKTLESLWRRYPEARQWLINIHKEELSKSISEKHNRRIEYGPLKGFIFHEDSHWSMPDRAAMILGFYEESVLCNIFNTENYRDTLVDLGAADGYYGVGLVACGRFNKSYCYESEEKGRRVIEETAKINSVKDSVFIHGAATSKFYLDIPADELKKCLIICDIEGAEFDVFDSNTFKALKYSEIIIELHDWFFEDGKEKISKLFSDSKTTHKIELIKSSGRNPFFASDLSGLCDNDRWLICSERRGREMTWLRLSPCNIKPRDDNPDSYIQNNFHHKNKDLFLHGHRFVDQMKNNYARNVFFENMILDNKNNPTSNEVVPRHIVQYWNDSPPEEVLDLLSEWRDIPGFEYSIYNEDEARDYIYNHIGTEGLTAYDFVDHPAIKSDLFRFCRIYEEGGIYIDADEKLKTDEFGLSQLLKWDLALSVRCWVNESTDDFPAKSEVITSDAIERSLNKEKITYYINNSPLIASPRHPFIHKALTSSIAGAIKQKNNKYPPDIHGISSPRMFTSEFLSWISECRNEQIARHLILLPDWYKSYCQEQWLNYKNTERNWRK